ncbi:MAG: hypothetical protein ABEJ61_07980 [Haloferacaceae archaeon]
MTDGQSGDSALVTFLRQKARTSLRAVVRYDAEGFEVLHARDDVGTRYEPVEVADAIERHRASETVDRRHESVLRAGAHGATLRVYEEAVVVHLPRTDRYGAVVSLDPGAAANCLSFVQACLARLRADERRSGGDDRGAPAADRVDDAD